MGTKATLAITILLLAASALAATHHVAADGSGEYLTVMAAVDAAADNDTILIAAGVYETDVDTGKRLHYLGAGSELTALDGAYSHKIFRIHSGAGGSFEALTLRNAAPINALDVPHGGDFVVRNCLFEDNVDDYFGGAISVGSATEMLIEDCVFRHNYAPSTGGAILAIQGSQVEVSRCFFQANWTNTFAGAINAGDGSYMTVSDCVFLGNWSNDVAGAIYFWESTGAVTNNTFVGNGSPGRATVVIHESWVSVHRNIFHGDTGGYGLQYHESPPFQSHDCNLYWDNAQGPISGESLGADAVLADPLFCVPQQDEYTLYDISPAAPDNSPCGQLIGALPVACGSTGIEASSFSRIKSLY